MFCTYHPLSFTHCSMHWSLAIKTYSILKQFCRSWLLITGTSIYLDTCSRAPRVNHFVEFKTYILKSNQSRLYIHIYPALCNEVVWHNALNYGGSQGDTLIYRSTWNITQNQQTDSEMIKWNFNEYIRRNLWREPLMSIGIMFVIVVRFKCPSE